MALNEIVYSGEGVISEPGPIRLNKDGTVGVEALNHLNALMAAIIQKMNRGLSRGNGQNATLTGNLFGQYLEFVTPSVADVEFQVPHGLDYTPVGYNLLNIDSKGYLYSSSIGSWGPEKIYLKSSVGGALCLIELF
jgi:hypothetical protein